MVNPLAGIRDKDSIKKSGFFVLLAVVVLIDIIFFMKPQVVRIFDVARQAKSVTAELAQAQDAIGKTGLYKKTIVLCEEKINRYEKMLPAEKEIPALLENLSVMARDSGIKILGITPITAGPDKESMQPGGDIYQEIPILISAKSGYHELGNFINNLENSDRFMKVVDIDIRSSKLTPSKHDVELVVLTYILLKGR